MKDLVTVGLDGTLQSLSAAVWAAAGGGASSGSAATPACLGPARG